MKILLNITFLIIVSSCSWNPEINESHKKLNDVMHKSQSTIDSTINEIDGITENLDGGTNAFEIDSMAYYKEVNLDNNSDVEIDSLIKIWTWNENILHPEISRIKNFIFSKEFLFQDWGIYSGTNFKFMLSIDEKLIKPQNLELIYTINYDSLRIFSQADYLDGIDRGIITHLTKDSLVIEWSTNDRGVYYSKNK